MGKLFYKLIFLVSVLRYTVCYVSKTDQSYDTIIVGLGPAGATAASTLAKAGKRVLALEAQDRIGGRIWTIPFDDGVVELGAEWIHGTELSRVYETAVKNNITVLPQGTSFEVFKSDGTESNKKLITELLDYLLDYLLAANHPPEKPEQVGIFLTKKLMDYHKEKHPEILNDHGFNNEFLDLTNFIVNNDYASNDWNDLTTQSDYKQLEGNQYVSWHRYGYKTFLELLLDQKVVCKDDSVYAANNTIVTVSLGVLKERYSTMFSPPIPDNKATAIDKLSIGVVAKTIFSFQQAWWPDVNVFFLFWSPEDKEAYKNDNYWMVRLKNVTRPMGSSNTLTVWANGDTAKVMETLPEDVLKCQLMDLFKKFMGKNLTVPEPTAMIRSQWYSNPFTRGSYTYDNLLKPVYPNARATLGEPLLDATGSPKVLFAGEATDLTHFSTVHGASDSGFREASRLLSINARV